MTVGRWVALLVAFTSSACVTRDTSYDGAVPDRTVYGDLPQARRLDVLAVAPFGSDAGWARQGLASVAPRLLEGLLAAHRLAPEAIRLGVVSTTIEGKSLCDSASLPGGVLISPRTMPTVLTGTASSDEWYYQIQSAPSPECHNPNFLEAAALAMDGRNGDFPRDDALLVVLLLMNMDDCSVQDLSIWDDPSAWGDEKLRATTRCYLPADGFLYPVERYPDLFLSNFSGRIFVAAVAWPVEPTFVSVEGYLLPDGKCQARIFPAPRIARFFDTVETLGNPRLQGGIYNIGCEAMSGSPPVTPMVDAILEYGGF